MFFFKKELVKRCHFGEFAQENKLRRINLPREYFYNLILLEA